MKPLISVVTITYNNFDYLFENIDSVLMQNYENIEYIIADDGSNNFPRNDVIKHISKKKKQNIKKVVYLFAENNKGTVKNLDSAYKIASGKYLIPLSQDDAFIDESVITKIVNKMEENMFNILFTSRLAFDRENHPQFFMPHYMDRNKIAHINSAERQYQAFVTGEHYNMASGSVMCLKKDFYAQLDGFDKRFRLWEDGPFILKVTGAGYALNFSFDIVSIKYRLGGISSGKATSIYKHDFDIYNNTLLLEKYDEMPLRIKRKIDYRRNSAKINSKYKKIVFWLLNCTIVGSKIYRKLQEKIYRHLDKKIISNNHDYGI